MTLLELKRSIQKEIDHVNDEGLLAQIKAILDNREKVFVIPEHMKEGIKQGKEDFRNGRFITLEELEKKYEKWLKE